MKIYFRVPYGYNLPFADGDDVNSYPKKNEFVTTSIQSEYRDTEVELRVQKVRHSSDLTEVTITLVEED